MIFKGTHHVVYITMKWVTPPPPSLNSRYWSHGTLWIKKSKCPLWFGLTIRNTNLNLSGETQTPEPLAGEGMFLLHRHILACGLYQFIPCHCGQGRTNWASVTHSFAVSVSTLCLLPVTSFSSGWKWKRLLQSSLAKKQLSPLILPTESGYHPFTPH